MIMSRVKKSFTLIELVIVIILISITYYLVFSTSSFSIKNDKNKVSLENIKEYLLTNFDYEDKLELICIENELKCYVRIDNEIKNDLIIENLFKVKPEVYEYNKELNVIDYETVAINDISEDIIFIFSLDNDYKANEFILDTFEDKIYVFNSIYNDVKLFTSLSEVTESFDQKQIEVQDAF